MSTITQVRFWNDCGYTNGAIEVPTADTQLPDPTGIITGPLNTNTADIFSHLSVVTPYAQLMNASYLEVTMDWNNGQPNQIFYGWIDSVGVKSDTDGFPQTVIDWHVDLWRTYLAQAQFGYGMVNRRPMVENDSIPPQPYPYRYKESKGPVIELGRGKSGIWWIFISTEGTTTVPAENPTPGKVVPYTYLCFPVDFHNINRKFSTGLATCPSAKDVITGQWDEALKLTPESIKGVFMSPIDPATATFNGDSVNLIGWIASAGLGAFGLNSIEGFNEAEIGLGGSFISDDKTTYVVQGFDGEVIGELPWGVPVTSLKYRTILSSTSGYVQIRTDIDGHANGTCWTLPMIPVDLTQNSWSSYVYSGARQADIDQRRLGADVKYHYAKQDIASHALDDTLMGMLAGGSAGGLFAPVGAGAGVATALASTALKAGTARLSYNYETGEVNDRQQAINDYRASMQPNGLIMAGSGFDSIEHGTGAIRIIKMETDLYSQTIRDDDIAKFGVHVSEPTADCTSLIEAGGGLQITNLIVKGDIPVDAKRFIKQRLASGVRII